MITATLTFKRTSTASGTVNAV